MSRVALVVLVCIAPSAVPAADALVLDGRIAAIESSAWTITGLEYRFNVEESGIAGEVLIRRIALEGAGRVFDDVRVDCSDIVITERRIACADARFTLTLPGLGRQRIAGGFSWDRQSSATTMVARDVAIAGAQMRFDIVASDDGIEARYAGQQLSLEGLLAVAGEFTDALAGYSGNGQIDVQGTYSAPADGSTRVRFTADIAGLSLANESGTVATENVLGRLDVGIDMRADATRFDVEFDASAGEAYLEPVYGNFGEHGFHLRLSDVETADFAAYRIGRFEVEQGSLVDAVGSGGVVIRDDGPARVSADVELRSASVSHLYTSLLQVSLAGTILGSLETAGRISGSVSIADNAPAAAVVKLDDVIIDDSLGRFAIYGLNGLIDWRASAAQRKAPSTLAWDSGTVYSLILGGGEVGIQFGDNDVELLAPLRLPTLGGALIINQLALFDYGTDDASGRLDAELEPVQLGQLTSALGWPAFSGTLSGRLPSLSLEQNTITVGGNLEARLFDGTMTVANLRVEQPFGRVPKMDADLRFRGLDLKRVTDAFSFGSIQGRLSGDVTGLKLQNWRPVAMDLYLYTPEDDRTPHRISQRAVENLASVGGSGAAAALSSGFLKFFEVFAYDRIGLRCRLKDRACAMSGVEAVKKGEPGRGYYIVKGKGVPRIDVVGYRDTVSWPGLVRQLTAITRSGSPVVN